MLTLVLTLHTFVTFSSDLSDVSHRKLLIQADRKDRDNNGGTPGIHGTDYDEKGNRQNHF